jgi:hypothetical protein
MAESKRRRAVKSKTHDEAYAKPDKAPTQETSGTARPTPEQIAELARKYWAQRGHTDGHHEEDWLRAEKELCAKAS